MKTESLKGSNSSRPKIQDGKRPRHPADSAGLMRIDYFKTDLWVIGGKQYTTPKDTVPKVLEGVFAPSKPSETEKISDHYNREKFAVDRLTSDEPGKEYFCYVHSKQTGKGVVLVTLRDDTFVVELFKGAHDKLFPFTKEEFLHALQASKVDVELDQLEFDGYSDDESENEHLQPSSPSASQARKS